MKFGTILNRKSRHPDHQVQKRRRMKLIRSLEVFFDIKGVPDERKPTQCVIGERTPKGKGERNTDVTSEFQKLIKQ